MQCSIASSKRPKPNDLILYDYLVQCMKRWPSLIQISNHFFPGTSHINIAPVGSWDAYDRNDIQFNFNDSHNHSHNHSHSQKSETDFISRNQQIGITTERGLLKNQSSGDNYLSCKRRCCSRHLKCISSD